ncbi:MAG: YggT family protein, partial [Pyrinomonadaceae bacterium]
NIIVPPKAPTVSAVRTVVRIRDVTFSDTSKLVNEVQIVSDVEPGKPISFVGYVIFGALAVYSLMIFARILLSWGTGPHNRLLHFLIRMTEPVLGPFRRIIPPVGMMDVSPIVVLFLLTLLQRAVAATLLQV